MCPAPRKPPNRALEPNLHSHPKGFRWKHPSGKYYYLGKNVSIAEANEAARALNLKFSRKSSIFDRIAGCDSESLRAVIESHQKSYLPVQRVSESTRKNRTYILRKIAASDLAACDVSVIRTGDIIQYLDTLASDSMRQQYRAQLFAVFKTAIKLNFITQNPVAHTDPPRVERQRNRLMAEGYAAIHSAAAPWLRNLMDLIRLTLQRPDDLVSLRFDAIVGNHLRVVQGKTGVRLAIHIRPEVREVLERCRDSVVSPYVIHRIPQRLKSREQRSQRKDHHTQMLRSQASRAFTALVRESDYFKGDRNPPTLYECKSLGIDQLRKCGWTMPQI